MNKETIKYIITDFHERNLPKTIERDYKIPLNTNKIIILTGIRRSGKTFIIYDTIQKLQNSGIDAKNILYLNFEDDRLFSIKLEDMDNILKAYYELYPEKINEKKYLFFDEIQNVPVWEKYIRRIYDTENIQLFITGSSSKLLSREISTALRGRGISYEIFPLSFPEFLRFRNVEYLTYSTKSDSIIINEFQKYMMIGGFPEVALADEEIQQKILQEYADMILYKDIIEHYGIKKKYLLKYLLKFCFSNPGTQFSVNKVYNDLRSQNFNISKNTLYEYTEYLQESLIMFFLPKYSTSIRRQAQNPRKMFVIDNGFIHSFANGVSTDFGKRLENILFLHFKRNDQTIFYYKNKVEVDFILVQGSGFQLLNASHSIFNESTARREVHSLAEGEKIFTGSDTMIIATDWDKRVIPDSVKIQSAWKYLLS